MSQDDRQDTESGLRLRTSIDLVVVVALTFFTLVLALWPGSAGSLIQFAVGIVFVMFLPGYALIATLFPDAGLSQPAPDDLATAEHSRRHDIDLIERVALSLVSSLAIVPLVGVILGFIPWGLTPTTLLIAVGAVTLILAAVAAIRRLRLQPEDRFSVPIGAASEMGAPSSTRRKILNVTLGAAILFAVSSVAYAIASPQDGEQYTEFQLLTEDDGELVAAGYPTTFTAGESQPLIVGIENHERESIVYTVVVQIETFEGDEVAETVELDRFSRDIDHGERWRGEHTVAPELVGDDLRLSYLLYSDEPPNDPLQENADEHLHIWIDVTE